MISVASGFAGAPRRIERLDGTAILAAEVIEISNVVIRLRHEERHVVLRAERTGSPVGGQGPRKIIEADQGDRHIAEHDGDSLRIFVWHQFGVSALVMRDRLFEAVLAVIDVPDVYFQAGQAPWIVQTRKNFPRTVRSLKPLCVTNREDHRLDRTAQSPRGFVPNAQRLVKPDSLLMVLDGGVVIAGGIESVGLCAQAKRQSLFPAQAFRNQHRGLSQVECFLRAYADFLDHQFRELLDNLLAEQLLVLPEKLAARRFAG